MHLGPRMPECYTDAQRDGIIANDDWACPACSHLAPAPKKERNNLSEQEAAAYPPRPQHSDHPGRGDAQATPQQHANQPDAPQLLQQVNSVLQALPKGWAAHLDGSQAIPTPTPAAISHILADLAWPSRGKHQLSQQQMQQHQHQGQQQPYQQQPQGV